MKGLFVSFLARDNGSCKGSKSLKDSKITDKRLLVRVTFWFHQDLNPEPCR